MDALDDLGASVVVTQPEAGHWVVELYGELDLQSAPDVERRLTDLATGADEIVFELAGLEFIDSTGLSVLIRCAQRATRVRVRHPRPIVERILVATGLDAILPVDTRDEIANGDDT